jgi:prevent-host-death family protein
MVMDSLHRKKVCIASEYKYYGHDYGHIEVSMKTIKASEFKAKCLSLMDDVAKSGEEIVVTKNGKPVSKLVPIKSKPREVYGLHRGMWQLMDELVEPVNENWDGD